MPNTPKPNDGCEILIDPMALKTFLTGLEQKLGQIIRVCYPDSITAVTLM